MKTHCQNRHDAKVRKQLNLLSIEVEATTSSQKKKKTAKTNERPSNKTGETQYNKTI